MALFQYCHNKPELEPENWVPRAGTQVFGSALCCGALWSGALNKVFWSNIEPFFCSIWSGAKWNSNVERSSGYVWSSSESFDWLIVGYWFQKWGYATFFAFLIIKIKKWTKILMNFEKCSRMLGRSLKQTKKGSESALEPLHGGCSKMLHRALEQAKKSAPALLPRTSSQAPCSVPAAPFHTQ